MGAGRRTTGDFFEKTLLKQSILMVALLWPGIRKQDPDFLQPHSGRKRLNKFQSLGADEMAVGKTRAFRFSDGPVNPITAQIDADA